MSSTPTAEQILKKHLVGQFNSEQEYDDYISRVLPEVIKAMEEQASSVGGMQFGEWQVCPKCNGEKFLPLQENGYSVFSTPLCDLCKGEGKIERPKSPTPILQKEDGWISVDKELPPKTDKFYYWLYFEFNDSYEQGDYDYGRNCFIDKFGTTLVRVSHWQKPSPPTTVNK